MVVVAVFAAGSTLAVGKSQSAVQEAQDAGTTFNESTFKCEV
jgi:hypothetical protein